MRRKILVGTLIAVAGLVASTALASASPSAVRSVRVVIMERDCTTCLSSTAGGSFSLLPLKRGVVEVDRGTFTAVTGPEKIVYRDGQLLELVSGTDTLAGKNGQIVIKWTVESVDAGFGNKVGVGRWSIVSGTEAYAELKGSGRFAVMFPGPPAKYLTAQYEGFVHT